MDYNELIRLSQYHNLHPYLEEQRYRLATLLFNLQQFNMIFKGGTMIWFVYGGLRYSRDLDFNLDDKSERLTEEKLRKILRKTFGNDKYLKSYRESETFINAEISFPGVTIPLGIKIKITVPYLYLDNPSHHYFTFPEYGLGTFAHRILDIKSVIADKINGLFKRKNYSDVLKDAFDLWYLLKIRNFSTTSAHLKHIFTITNIEFNIGKLKQRLNRAKKKKHEFNQYLLPSFKGDLDKIIDEVYQEVKLYENLGI